MESIQPLYIVTGAPGAGKTQTVKALHEQKSALLVFDGDDLLPVLSRLTGLSLATSEQTWPIYREVWITILHLIANNGHIAVLFIPISLTEIPHSTFQRAIKLALLDCPDDVRRQRLAQRKWTSFQIEEALLDAQELRQQAFVRFDTSLMNCSQVAKAILEWIKSN